MSNAYGTENFDELRDAALCVLLETYPTVAVPVVTAILSGNTATVSTRVHAISLLALTAQALSGHSTPPPPSVAESVNSRLTQYAPSGPPPLRPRTSAPNSIDGSKVIKVEESFHVDGVSSFKGGSHSPGVKSVLNGKTGVLSGLRGPSTVVKRPVSLEKMKSRSKTTYYRNRFAPLLNLFYSPIVSLLEPNRTATFGDASSSDALNGRGNSRLGYEAVARIQALDHSALVQSLRESKFDENPKSISSSRGSSSIQDSSRMSPKGPKGEPEYLNPQPQHLFSICRPAKETDSHSISLKDFTPLELNTDGVDCMVYAQALTAIGIFTECARNTVHQRQTYTATLKVPTQRYSK